MSVPFSSGMMCDLRRRLSRNPLATIEDGGFSGDDRLQRQKPVLSGKDESFTPRAQGSGGIGLGEGPSVPAESVSNPVGVGAGDG